MAKSCDCGGHGILLRAFTHRPTYHTKVKFLILFNNRKVLATVSKQERNV